MSVSERTYLAARAMPFCKGCGHAHVLRRLDEALRRLEIPPRDVCLVTDIGCVGLADALFETVHTVHTTHGRSTAFATGIQIADGILADGRLRTIVLIGDGGAMIGLQHVVGAALLDADLTVLVCNNFLFGMTGGQNSAFSPIGFVTPTTPRGNVVPPIDVCLVARACGARFVARKLATDRDLGEVVAAAIAHPGFALVEVVELCTEHGTTRNDLKGAALPDILRAHGQELGVLCGSAGGVPARESRDSQATGQAGAGPDGAEVAVPDRRDFAARYRQRYPCRPTPPEAPDDRIVPSLASDLRGCIGIVVAGSAGERVQSAARRFCEAAVRSGLWATQKNDNPVTQGSGFSLSEILVASDPIHYSGIDSPDAVIVVSGDGLVELAQKRVFEGLRSGSLLLLDEGLDVPPTRARVERLPFRKQHGGAHAAGAALAHYLETACIFPPAAFAISGGG